MKKQLLLIIILFSVINLNAQKDPGDDFTVTDIYGHTHHLYADYLNQDTWVFVDFFTGGCEPCQYLAPVLDTVFRDFGCNYGDIAFLGIDVYGFDYNVWNFTEDFNMTFPTASGNDGGGHDVFVDYGYGMTPYKILIDPTGKVIIDDMTIHYASQLRDSLFRLGFSMQECEGNDFMFYALISESDSIVGDINADERSITVNMPSGTDFTSLQAFFRNAVNSEISVNGNEQISSITENDFSSGSLEYQITSETGSSEIWTVFVNTGSVNDFPEEDISIYPNPNNGNFIIETPLINKSGNNKHADIYSLTGKLIYTSELNTEFTDIELKEISKGIYFIHITIKNTTYIKKLIIK